jgi:hypothetical protein
MRAATRAHDGPKEGPGEPLQVPDGSGGPMRAPRRTFIAFY